MVHNQTMANWHDEHRPSRHGGSDMSAGDIPDPIDIALRIPAAFGLKHRGEPAHQTLHARITHPNLLKPLQTEGIQSPNPQWDFRAHASFSHRALEQPLAIEVRDEHGATLGRATLDLADLKRKHHLDSLVTLRAGNQSAGIIQIYAINRHLNENAPGVRVDDLNAWRQQVGNDVARLGFVEAWRRHWREIIYVHHSEHFDDDVLGRTLYDWVWRDPTLGGHFRGLPEDEANQLIDWLADADAGRLMQDPPRGALDEMRTLFHREAEPCPDIQEADGSPVYCLTREAFRNWGRTVQNTPYLTCVPRTVTGVQNIVRWARENDRKVRASGYRHTWGDLYSANDQVLISTLPLDVVEELPAQQPDMDPDNQLQGIRITGHIQEDGQTKALCRIGAGTTNEQFRRWCLSDAGGGKSWTIPLNVIMVEITYGGSNAPICHGAGLHSKTLSDLVHAIEFVNARGEVQVVDDPEQLKAAAGCFGMLGIVTAVTLKLDPMSYAVLKPTKPRVALAIPPPDGFSVPRQIDMSGITQADMDAAMAEFVRAAEQDYYTEWFWFAYQDKCWVNTWHNDGREEDAEEYPGPENAFIDQVASYLAHLGNQTLIKLLPDRVQAEMLAAAAMNSLPADTQTTAYLIEALHFQRGIQNMRVLDMELEIPIPPHPDDPTKPDWSICQKAWWDTIKCLYDRDDSPMKITLEMRVMGGSDITMAPQHGNDLGTCSIEVLTTLNSEPAAWLAFMQDLTDLWDSYRDPAGNRLNVRPHWAKQWQGLQFRGLTDTEYLKTVAYRDRVPEFRSQLLRVAAAGGYTLADIRARFTNPLIEHVFGDVFA